MKVKLIAMPLALTLLLTACGGTNVASIKPLSLEEVAGSRMTQMTQDEKDGLIYQYVSDRIVVDKDRLMQMTSTDYNRVTSLLTSIDEELKGKPNGSLTDEYANYMLMEFARTPYQWERSDVKPAGFDPAARLYFVDVTYKTNGAYKKVVPSSKIVMGEAQEEDLKQKRYMDYLSYLTKRSEGKSAEASADLAYFKKAWGEVEEVMNEQQGVSLVDRVRKTPHPSIGALTYSGLVNDSRFSGGAEMTFRFVFKYKFNLGEETDLQVNSVYLKNFETAQAEKYLNQEPDTVNGAEVLSPFIDRLINSYNKAVEESNSTGLYSLFTDYAGVDKYYDDMNKYTYVSTGGYNYEILERRGTDVLVKVKRINRIRAKGSGMSLPYYAEDLIFNVELSQDDKLRIKSVNLLKSELVGEPLSVIKNVSGISDMIQYSGESFTESNQEQVEEVVKQFSDLVYHNEVGTSKYTDIVDIGVTKMTAQRMADTIRAIKDPKRKVTYVVSWNTKTNVYVSLTLREIFQSGSSNLNTESVIDLVNRQGEWKVVNYTRTLSVQSELSEINTKNALVEDTADGQIVPKTEDETETTDSVDMN